jgi:hypothetical protein
MPKTIWRLARSLNTVVVSALCFSICATTSSADAIPSRLAVGEAVSVAGAAPPGGFIASCATLDDFRASQMGGRPCPLSAPSGWPGTVLQIDRSMVRDEPGLALRNLRTAVQVVSFGLTGWLSASVVVPLLPRGTQLTIATKDRAGSPMFPRLSVWSDAPIGTLADGTRVSVTVQRGEWYEVRVLSGGLAGQTGWIDGLDVHTEDGYSPLSWRDL